MKYKEFDTVRINNGIMKGELGVILMAYREPQEAYEVEILDEKGNHKAQCVLRPSDFDYEEEYRNVGD